MLDLVAVATCPAAFVVALASTFLRARPPRGTIVMALLVAAGALTSALAALSLVGGPPLSSLAACFATAMGPATVAGGWLGARALRPA